MPVVKAKQNYAVQNIEGAKLFAVKGDGIGAGAWIGLLILCAILGLLISIFSEFFAILITVLLLVMVVFYAVNKSSTTRFAINNGDVFIYPSISKLNVIVMVILFAIFPILGMLFLMGLWIFRTSNSKNIFDNFSNSYGKLDQYLGTEIGQVFVHGGNERFVAHRTGNTFVFGSGFVGLAAVSSAALSNTASRFGADISNMISSSTAARSYSVGFRHGAQDVYLVKNVRSETAQQLAQDVASCLEK